MSFLFKLQSNCLDLDVVTMALVVTDDRKPEDRVAFYQCGFCFIETQCNIDVTFSMVIMLTM